MRTLLILRGAPGAGKSTWIRNNHLEDFTLCPDEIRIKCATREQSLDGSTVIIRNPEVESKAWKILFDLLEFRMSRGEFTIIDATASKTKDLQQYKDLATQYKYKMYCVDFTKVPLEVCLTQNKLRPSFKWVPDESIKNIYARFATQQVPSGITIIDPDTALEQIKTQPIDFTGQYKKIVFIGDIHGCFDTLMQYFKDGISPDTQYIFTGDYIDRGNQNAEVMHWLQSIMTLPNVCLLEGNHEVHLRDYGADIPAKSKEFNLKTKSQLEAGNYTPKMARMFYRKLRQMSHIIFAGKEILVCHGGVLPLAYNNVFRATQDFIKGVGNYVDAERIAEEWIGLSTDNQYLIHGHRNESELPVQASDRVFNLEGKVERGGKLRIVELNDSGDFTTFEFECCQPITEELDTTSYKVDTVADSVLYLRNNPFVQEKKLDNGISSFNFTKEAFFKSNWNRQTILARGLFIDTDNNKIMARSYEKFFKINEVPATELVALKNKLQYPVTAYIKENGFLGIVSYNYLTDDLFIASKSTNKGDYVEYFKNILSEKLKINLYNFLKEKYLSNNPITLVFEVIDIENDPHIIEYKESTVVLLDAVSNTLAFETKPYEELVQIASILECSVKKKAFTINNWDEFKSLYYDLQEDSFTFEGEPIEGVVFEDASGFMTKCKSKYYNTWKMLRSVADQTLRRGYITRTGGLTSAEENFFYGFCRELFKKDRDPNTKKYPYKTDIISLRNKYKTKD